MTIATVAACLAPLPDPAVCPAPAQNDYCQLAPDFTFDGGGFDPDSGFPDDVGLPCTCSDKCARAACPSGTACYPAPDCPPAVRSAYPTAACGQLDVVVPDPNPSMLTCACGADTCALACDGAGIVIGPDQSPSGSGQTFALVLPRDLPSSATLRAMVRMRGSGVLTLSVANSDIDASSGFTSMGSLGTFNLPNRLQEFDDKIDLGPSSFYTWTSSSDRPDILFASTDGTSNIEIDCIVPFYVQ